MTATPSPTASAAQIADAIRGEINSGAIEPGKKIPSERALIERHGVSKMTARSAVQILISEGLVEGRRGKGVYVKQYRPIIRRGLQRLSAELRDAGVSPWDADDDRKPEVTDLNIETREAPSDIAAVLKVDTVVIRSRTYVIDGKPVMRSISYLPAELALGTPIAQPDTGPGGVYARLAELGHAPVAFREDIQAHPPTPKERETLRLTGSTPVFHITRLALQADGVAVEVNRMILDSSAYVLRYEFPAV